MLQHNEHPLDGELKHNYKQEQTTLKMMIIWIFHNLKFLFIPGYHLDDLFERRYQYELKFPKKRRLYRYKTPLFIFGLGAVLFLCSLAIFQDWVSPYTYLEATIYTGLNFNMESYFPPSLEHLFGQTFRGFDVLSRIIFGTRPVLIFTLTSTLIASLIGIIIGAISGYYGGWLDVVFMRIMDIILSFPGVIFAIIFITIWGGDFINLILIYSIIGIPYFARIIRTEVEKEKALPYIIGGKVAGANNIRIIFRHILPNCMQSLIVAASYNIARNILSLAVLGFLRYGNIGWIEWGYDIAIALGQLYRAPWAVFYPTLGILISVLGFLLLGDSLSDIGLLRYEKL